MYLYPYSNTLKQHILHIAQNYRGIFQTEIVNNMNIGKNGVNRLLHQASPNFS